jgi:hypothetical protein
MGLTSYYNQEIVKRGAASPGIEQPLSYFVHEALYCSLFSNAAIKIRKLRLNKNIPHSIPPIS